MAESARARKQLERFRAQQAGRGVWESHWDDLARVMLPRRLGFTSAVAPGEKRTNDLYDGTPMQAAVGLANAIGGMLRPDGEKIAYIKAADDADERIGEAKDWLAEKEEQLDDVLKDPKARLRQATGECDLDLVVFGTGCIFEGEGRGLDHLMFQSVHLKDAYPMFDAEGAPAGLRRRRKLTVAQAVEEFGLGNVSEEVRR